MLEAILLAVLIAAGLAFLGSVIHYGNDSKFLDGKDE